MKTKTVKLSELKKDTLLYKIASAMVKEYGWYGYTDENDERVKVVA